METIELVKPSTKTVSTAPLTMYVGCPHCGVVMNVLDIPAHLPDCNAKDGWQG